MNPLLKLKALLEEEYKTVFAREHLENFISNEAFTFKKRKIDIIYYYLENEKQRNKLYYQIKKIWIN